MVSLTSGENESHQRLVARGGKAATFLLPLRNARDYDLVWACARHSTQYISIYLSTHIHTRLCNRETGIIRRAVWKLRGRHVCHISGVRKPEDETRHDLSREWYFNRYLSRLNNSPKPKWHWKDGFFFTLLSSNAVDRTRNHIQSLFSSYLFPFVNHYPYLKLMFTSIYLFVDASLATRSIYRLNSLAVLKGFQGFLNMPGLYNFSDFWITF